MTRAYNRSFRAEDVAGNPLAGAQISLWDSKTDGNQITDGITDLSGNIIAGGVITCDQWGFMPDFLDTLDRPDIWAIGSASGTITGVERVLLDPSDTDTRVASLETLTSSLSDAVDARVKTAGGSVVEIPDGDTTTQALTIRLPSGDRSSAPDTLACYVNTGTPTSPVWKRTGYFNEDGLIRVVSIADNQVPLRIKAASITQTANLIEVTDIDNVPLGGFQADGSVFAANIGSARVSAGTIAPTSPRAGDLWSDIGETPPILKMFDGGAWLVVAPTSVPTPAAAPAFQDATEAFVNGFTWTADRPTSGDSLFACLAWNTVDDVTTVPPGWTLVDQIIGASGRSAVWKAAGDVPTLTWAWDLHLTQPKVSGVVLGYEACSVAVHDELLHAGAASTSHAAPDITVATVPATLLRLWWDRSSTTTSITLPGGVTSRAQQLGTGSASCAVQAADAVTSSAGAVGTATATFNASTANAGGYSLSLVAA